MSTAGDGSAAQNAYAYENGGVGGKSRKRPNRRFQTTPYDRPATALRNPGWLSKLVVDPASKLISAGAQRFFSSVFRKRLLPPPASPPLQPEYRQESMNGHQESVPDNHVRAQELAGNEGGNPSSSYVKNGLSELELLLNGKTFTRSEIDRLTRLLHSRAVDLPAKDAGKRIDPNCSIQNATLNLMSDSVSLGQFPISLEGSTTERARAHRDILNPTIGKALLEDEIASPTELAKAYMGSRSFEASSSKSGLRSQITKEKAVLINNTMPFGSISPNTSLAVNTTGHLGTPLNGSTPPRFRGRSAIYNMARTPYSRVHSTSIQQDGRSTSHGYTRPSSSAFQPAWSAGQFGSRPAALKRRSSVLDDDIGSVGPVRRIRQKNNLLSHGSSLSSRGLGSDVSQLQKLPLMDEAKNKVSNTASTSYAHVPPKSCEMATKILEHLEKMTPKEKSSESKLAAARERSPVKLTQNMLRGQALRSLEDLDASKFLQNAVTDQKLGDQSIGSLPGPRDFAAQKQSKVEENGPTNFIIKSAAVVNTDVVVPTKDIKPSAVTADAAMPKFVTQSSERKRAFKMSAHEDFLELDDDAHSTGLTSESLDGRQGGGMEKSIINGKSIPSEVVGLDKTPVYPELKTLSPAVLSNGTELATGNDAPAGEKHTGFTFSSSNVLGSSPQAALLSHSTLAAEKPPTVGDAPHFLSFGSKTVGEIPSSLESKSENSSSFVNASADPTNAPVKVLEFYKSGTKSYQQDIIVNGNAGTSSLGSSSMSAAISVFSTGAPSSDLTTNNAPPASTVSTKLSSSPSMSTKLADQNSTNCFSNMVSSSSATTTFNTDGTSSSFATSNSGLSESNVAPSIFSAPTSTIANAGNTDLEFKAEKATSFGNSSNVSFGSTFTSVSPESSTLGLGSFISSSAASSQSQVSLTGSGSALSTQPSSAGSAITTASESMPVQFGSPSSPLVFGSSGSSSFTSSSIFGSSGSSSFTSSSIFGSSAPATAFSVSGTSSAQSSSASTTETNLVSSSVFKFGVGSSASASMSNAVTSSSGVTPGTFTFGASSAPSSTPSSSVAPAIFSFGASSAPSSTPSSSVAPAIFSFGASSSASSSATSGNSTAPAMFPFGVSSSVSSSSSATSPSTFSFGASQPLSSGTNSVSSSGAISSPFGSSWQSTKSPVFGATPSTGFSFGASSSSFGLTNSTPSVFGSSTGPSSSPIFPFSATSATTSSLSTSSTQTVFGNPISAFASTAGNNDQMNTEDSSMAEDPVQSSTPVAPVFGQSPVAPSPQSFMFGSSVPSPAAVSFQFGGQQNPAASQFGGQQNPAAASQNPSQFQASSSLEFNAGGSFSLGSAGPDKTGRRIVKINKNRNRKR